MLPIVSDSFEFAGQNPTTEEKMKRADVWAKILFGIIPEERLPDVFAVAVRLHKSNFPINGYELKTAWEMLDASEREAQEKQRVEAAKGNPILMCGHYHLHAGDKTKGEIYGDPFQNGKDEKFPCPACRREDNENWKKLQISLYGEHQPKTVIVPEIDPQFRRNIFVSPTEEIIDPKLGEQLAVEYNELLFRKESDELTRKLYFAVFNEGGNCFCYLERQSQTFSLQEFRKKIERFREGLEDK